MDRERDGGWGQLQAGLAHGVFSYHQWWACMIDLRLFGFALWLRWEWLHRVEPDKGWARLPVKQEPVITAMFEASWTVRLGDDMTTSFWMDRWLSVGPLHSFALALFNATLRTGHDRSVRDALLNRRWVRDITKATTTQVL